MNNTFPLQYLFLHIRWLHYCLRFFCFLFGKLQCASCLLPMRCVEGACSFGLLGEAAQVAHLAVDPDLGPPLAAGLVPAHAAGASTWCLAVAVPATAALPPSPLLLGCTATPRLYSFSTRTVDSYSCSYYE
eukprot:COSAG01_NODE_19530_length_1004_cov_14.342541_2_plen_131_part_00